MNVEIGAEAAQFPEKEYINAIAFAVFAFSNSHCTFMSDYFFYMCNLLGLDVVIRFVSNLFAETVHVL